MIKSPIANWKPQTEQGLDNASLLKAHAARKRAKTADEIKKVGRSEASKERPAPGTERSKLLSAAHKRQLDADRFRLFHVPLHQRISLPTDEHWTLFTERGQPRLMPTGSHAATVDEWHAALEHSKPENRIDRISSAGTLRAALKLVRQSLCHPKQLWLQPDSPWLCLWLPSCGLVSEARDLLSHNPSLEHFPKLYLPATWYTVRRRGGQEGASIYPSWRSAIGKGEPEGHYGTYALVYLDSPAQRDPLYESTLARLRLAGFGVIELTRGVVFQPVASLVLHRYITDQPLQRVPLCKFGGRTYTHQTFHKDAKVVLDFPEHTDPSQKTKASLQLSATEKEQYQVLKQRMVAPIDLKEEGRQ